MSHIPPASTYAYFPHYQHLPPEWLMLQLMNLQGHITITQGPLVYAMAQSWCCMSTGLDKCMMSILC